MVVKMYLELCLLMVLVVFECSGLAPAVKVMLISLVAASAITMLIARKLGIVPAV